MTQAFKCDICGECITNEQDAQSERQLARETTTINSVSVDISISIEVYVSHVCDTCWALTLQKVKAWMNANI
jgi:hypothetical protein